MLTKYMVTELMSESEKSASPGCPAEIINQENHA